MAYPKGAPKPPNSGRQLGTRNKATKEINDLLQSMECDPIEGMVRIAQGNVDCNVCRGKLKTRYKLPEGQHAVDCEIRRFQEDPKVTPKSLGHPRTPPTCTCEGIGIRTCESCYGSGWEIIPPELRGRMYAEIAKYHRPMRKAIEHTVETIESPAAVLRERFKRHGNEPPKQS